MGSLKMPVTETQKQNAINAINEHCESELEYRTTHRDAGDDYAHLVCESWCSQKTRDMVQSFDSYKPQWQLLGIDKRWKDIKPDILEDMALETFDMVPGSIWGLFDNDCIILESFPIDEIEVDLSPLGIDDSTMDLIREDCEPYISGTNYAYIVSDSVWYAIVNVESLNIKIEQYISSMES